MEEVENELGCKELGKEGLELDWRTVKMERGDTVMMKEMEAGCPSGLEEDTETLVGFGKRLKFGEAEIACLALGGRWEPPQGEEEVMMIKESLGGFKEMCDSKFWVPIRKQQGR